MNGNDEKLFEAEGYAMMGAGFEVYNHLGHGFLEEVYQEPWKWNSRPEGSRLSPNRGSKCFTKNDRCSNITKPIFSFIPKLSWRSKPLERSRRNTRPNSSMN